MNKYVKHKKHVQELWKEFHETISFTARVEIMKTIEGYTNQHGLDAEGNKLIIPALRYSEETIKCLIEAYCNSISFMEQLNDIMNAGSDYNNKVKLNVGQTIRVGLGFDNGFVDPQITDENALDDRINEVLFLAYNTGEDAKELARKIYEGLIPLRKEYFKRGFDEAKIEETHLIEVMAACIMCKCIIKQVERIGFHADESKDDAGDKLWTAYEKLLGHDFQQNRDGERCYKKLAELIESIEEPHRDIARDRAKEFHKFTSTLIPKKGDTTNEN